MNLNTPGLWFFDVDNALGDRCTTPIILRPGTEKNRKRCHGVAVRRAKTVLPNHPPFKVVQSYQLP